MEPLSTLALVAAFLAPVPVTRVPDWGRSGMGKLAGHSVDATFGEGVIERQAVATEAVIFSSSGGVPYDRMDAIFREVDAYASLKDGWDGENSRGASPQSLDAAIAFMKAYPSGLPLPTPMISAVGEIGYFWDMDNGYADISFDSEGLASLFTRHQNGTEAFSEQLGREAFTRDWFFVTFGPIAAPALEAA